MSRRTCRTGAIQVLTRLLVPPLVGRSDIRVQLPFAAGDDSLPEPDLALVEPMYFGKAHPDRFPDHRGRRRFAKVRPPEKAELYATAGVPEYWIVNLGEKMIERYSEPGAGAYTRVTPFRTEERWRRSRFPTSPSRSERFSAIDSGPRPQRQCGAQTRRNVSSRSSVGNGFGRVLDPTELLADRLSGETGGGQDDDRGLADRRIFELLGPKVPPVHHRHHEIEDDGVGAQAGVHELRKPCLPFSAATTR